MKHLCEEWVVYDSAYMDEDQNNDLSNGQLGHSAGISQSVVIVAVVEEGKNLEQLEVNCYEGIQHFEIEWDLSSLEYERTSPSHIKDQLCACCGQAIPKV